MTTLLGWGPSHPILARRRAASVKELHAERAAAIQALGTQGEPGVGDQLSCTWVVPCNHARAVKSLLMVS